jgi:hypothetical protein
LLDRNFCFIKNWPNIFCFAGVAPMDNQTAIAVQSLLESQTVPDTSAGQEGLQPPPMLMVIFILSLFVFTLRRGRGRCFPMRQMQKAVQFSVIICHSQADKMHFSSQQELSGINWNSGSSQPKHCLFTNTILHHI